MGDKSIKGQSPILFDPLLERPERPRPFKRLRGRSKRGFDPNKIKPPVLQKKPDKVLKNG